MTGVTMESQHMNTDDEQQKSHGSPLDDHEETPKGNGCGQWLDARKAMVNRQIDSNVTVSIMLIATTCILYCGDVRTLIAVGAGADLASLILSSIVLVLFVTEMALLCWCKEKYLRRPNLVVLKNLFTLDSWSDRDSVFSWWAQIANASHFGSFYFWLDLLSALSIVIGILWVNRLGRDDPYDIDSDDTDRATIAGENSARVIRMVRLVRLAKFFKYFSTDNHSFASSERSSDATSQASHVGAEMFDRTTKKVVVGILFMLLGIPLLHPDKSQYLTKFSMKMAFEHRKWISTNDTGEIEIKQLHFAEAFLIGRGHCIDIMYNGFNDTVQLDTVSSSRSRLQELGDEALDSCTMTDNDYGTSMTALFDVTGRNREDSFLGVLLTSFVLVLLGLAILSFNQDIHVLVILPIEHMMHLVREISENPLGKQLSRMLDNNMHNDDGMETTRLIRTISKIAGLMRVGFGEAGADIIGQNLNFTHGTDRMNLLGNGRKIHSIFGFCDVRQFTDTTECLQEEVMLFVNRIAHILHSIVVQCDGAVNKNVGDAFLLTWKIDIANVTHGCEDHNYAADKALYSFVKTMIEMCRHEDFLCKFSPRTLSELYERMPGYKCRIGCGLHFGWAIEGAIGSSKKIDASYISPHVYMTESLECATKEYGTSILMSEPFYDLLSKEAMAGCRKVDIVKKRDSERVISLYTYDIDLGVEFSKIKTRTCSKLPKRRKTKFSLIAVQSGPNDRDLVVSVWEMQWTFKYFLCGS
jgi:class 3 adenylate cyclase